MLLKIFGLDEMQFFNLTLLIMIDKYVHIIIEKYHMYSEICQIRQFFNYKFLIFKRIFKHNSI